MTTGRIDLHMHTTCSDGVLKPSELLDRVRSKNLTAFSVTDHDTIGAYQELNKLLTADDPELIPGVELSASLGDSDLHLLVYFFDPENQPLCAAMEKFRQNRNHRATLMVEKLRGLGMKINLADIEEVANDAPIGRPHIAEAMAKKGVVSTYDKAFSNYIANGRPAYVAKVQFEPEEAINLAHDAGGVVILAHPMLDNNQRHIEKLIPLGLDGIETRHPYHSVENTNYLEGIADRFRLLKSGGSDFHGRNTRYADVGDVEVPNEYLNKLREKANNRRESC